MDAIYLRRNCLLSEERIDYEERILGRISAISGCIKFARLCNKQGLYNNDKTLGEIEMGSCSNRPDTKEDNACQGVKSRKFRAQS